MHYGDRPRSVLLVEDHPLMRALVSDALTHAGFEVHTRPNAAGAIADWDEIEPDVLVTDIDLGARPNGVELATIVRARSPRTAIVFLTNFPKAAVASTIAGAPSGTSYVNKSAVDTVSELITAVESALAQTPVSVDRERPVSDPDAAIDQLSASQLDTLQRIAQGWSNAEIARQRGTTLRAAERTIARTYETLGLAHDTTVTPRVAATNLYVRVFGTPTVTAAPHDASAMEPEPEPEPSSATPEGIPQP